MRIVVEGNLSQAASYGIVNFRLGQALAELGHKVSFVSLDVPQDDIASLLNSHNQASLEMSAGEPEYADVRIRQIWPPIWVRRKPDELLIVIQPWEFGSIPLEWIDGIKNVDAIWVPSEYTKRGYIQSGIDSAKVWVVPNGADFEGVERRRDINRERKRLVYVGGAIYRKGIDILVDALDILDDNTLNSLSLIVKESGRDTFYQGQSLIDTSLESHPRVQAITKLKSEHMDRRDLLELMADCDALVHPYRAEGFGLPILEAMTIGTPIIHTQGGATNEFCGPGESLLIPSSLRVADLPKVGNSMLADKCYWMEPSTEQLGQLIATFVQGGTNLETLADLAKIRAQDFSWANVGKIAHEAITRLADGKTPQDSLASLEKDISDALERSGSRPAPILSRLVAVGDVSTAFNLASYFEGQIDPRESTDIGSVRERLASISSNAPDVWSGGPYRMIVTAAQFQSEGHFGYVHDFEGGDQATYAIALQLSGYLQNCSSVLDLACGQGSMLRVLRNQGKKTQGLEADPSLVRKLIADGFTIHEGYIPSDLDKFDFEDFDGVFLGHIVEHLQPNEFETLLQWIYENIADKGTVVIQTPDFANSAVGLQNFWLDSSHVRPYPIPLLKSILSKSGFVPVDGACRKIPEIAPLDIVAVARRIPRNRTNYSPQSPKATRRIQVGHYALFSGESGFSQASRGLLDQAGLGNEGIDTIRISVDQNGPSQPNPGQAIPLSLSDRIEHDVAIVDVPAGWLAGINPAARARHRIARTTFEATPLPLQLQNTVGSFDEVWCFSHYDAEILIQSGVESGAVFIIPPGIAIPHPETILGLRQSISRETFRFLSVFNFEPRKNPEALIKAFSSVASEISGVELILKLGGINAEMFETWLTNVLEPTRLPQIRNRIHVIAGTLPRENLLALYLQSDAFVLPTRGEGYGLPFLEALAYGLPTICPDIGGHREFCNESNSLLVSSYEAPALASAGAEVFRESFWREVDVADLAKEMCEAATHPDRLDELGKQGMAAAAKFTETACQEASLKRLLEITGSKKAKLRAEIAAQKAWPR